MEHSAAACSVCGILFSNSSNLRKHTRKFHLDKFESIFGSKPKSFSVSADSDRTRMCDACGKRFSKYSNLRAHVRTFHEDKLDLLAPKKKYNHQCEECGKQFTHLIQFKRHNKQHLLSTTKTTPDEKSAKSRFKCPLCAHQDTCNKAILNHFQTVHDVKIEFENIEFSTLDQFQSWKNEIEKVTKAFYTITSSNKNNSGTKSKYLCHRSGSYAPKGKGLRHIKTQGTNKIGGFCPASLLLSSKVDGKYTVQYTKTHVGHDMDLGRLTLTSVERRQIATKIASKIPPSVILEEIKGSLIANCNLERIHLLSKKDLYNIEQEFKHTNDVLSVEAWIKEMDNDVLFYKAQNSVDPQYPLLKSEDFVLVIMTDGQKDVLEKYCSDCICIDGVNSYGFELTTLLIVDQIREGFPCAFLLSNRSDEEVFSIFFSRIKEVLGFKIKPKMFMSDMTEALYNAWLTVMIPAEFRLYCSWHVDKDWRKHLNKINSKEKQVIVYKNLRTLLHETDKVAFNQLIESFLMLLMKDEETKEFGLYFQTFKKVENWAYCHWLDNGLNTNAHIERMHRTLKHLCIKRLDKAIVAIMKFVRDTLNIDYRGKLKNIRERHKSSKQLDPNLVLKSKLGWEVQSASTSEIYRVEEIKQNCECELNCDECGACMHLYMCSCSDSSVKWNMCKHIHLVCMRRKAHSIDNDINLELDIQISEEEYHLHIDHQSNEAVLSAETAEGFSKTKSKVIDLNAEKEKILASLTQTVSSITSVEGLDAIKHMVSSMNPVLDAVQNKIGQKLFLPLSNADLTLDNKNVEPQKPFARTKKIVKKRKV